MAPNPVWGWLHNVRHCPLLSFCTPGVQVFEKFLAGDTLQDCYAAVAAVANRWLDMLDTQVRLKQPQRAAPGPNVPAPVGQWTALNRDAGQQRHVEVSADTSVGAGCKTSCEPGLSDASAVCIWILLRGLAAVCFVARGILTGISCIVTVLLYTMHSHCLVAGSSQVLVAVLPFGCRAST